MLILFPIIAGFLQYSRVQGFKEALGYLVTSGTNGTYELSIGETDMNLWQLSFSLNDIVVSKTNPLDSSGIVAVKSKQFKVTLGSLFSSISKKQFDIKELSISEPVAIVGLNDRQSETTTDAQEPVNIAHEIAQFYPGIVSLLNQFNIKLFRIDRAEVQLDESQHQYEIRLLDLVVSDWDMANFTNEAEFKWSLGSQLINLKRSHLAFSSIVYDYQANQFSILDYNIAQNDSLDRTVIDVSGKSLQINNLDYQALVSNEQYIFEQLSIDEPIITVYVYPHEKRVNSVQYPISSLLKRNLGELKITDFLLKDAQLELYVYGELDTLSLHLPKLNLETKNIVVTKDSSTIMIETLNLDLGNTIFEPGGSLLLQFNKLRYDEDYNLEIDFIELLDQATGAQLMTCEYLELFNFDFFHYYFENEVNADSLLLRNGRLNINHGVPNLKSTNKRKPTGGKRKEPPTIQIDKAIFDDIDLNLDLGKQQLQAKRITAILGDLVRSGQTSYHLHLLKSLNLTYHDTIEEIDVNLANVLYSPDNLQLGKLEGKYHGLDISLDDLNAHLKHDFSLDEQWHNQLNRLDVRRIELTGTMPVSKKKGRGPLKKMNFEELKLSQFQIDIHTPDSGRVSINGNDLLLHQPTFAENKIALDQGQVEIVSAFFESESIYCTMGPATINSDSNSLVEHIQFRPDSGKVIAAESIEIGPWRKALDSLTMNYLQVDQLEYSTTNSNIKSTAESIRFQNINWNQQQGPKADEVYIYAPDINLKSNKEGETTKGGERSKGINITPLKMFGKIHVDPGQLTIDDKKVSFKQIELSGKDERKDLDLKEISFVSPNSSFHIDRVWSTKSNLNIDSITIVPNENYIKQIQTERDVGAGQFYKIQIRDIDWQVLHDSAKVKAKEVLLDGFDVSVRRDKTLPDQEKTTKPYLLAGMFPIIPNFSIPRIITQHGNISYHEVGEKTGKEGSVKISDINVTLNRFHSLDKKEKVLKGTAMLYNQGKMQVEYNRLDSGRFYLKARMEDFPLESLNQMVDPTQSARIESGYLHEYEFEIIADSVKATGTALISYDDLHIKLFKKDSPDETNLGSELLTLLVDKIILKHSKEGAQTNFRRDRVAHKGPINYWVKATVQGALSVIQKGKRKKRRKKPK